MTHDDIGTVRWFGATWGAPVNDPRAHIPTPIGEKCTRCGEIFNDRDNGISIPYSDLESFATRIAYHRACFLADIGARLDL